MTKYIDAQGRTWGSAEEALTDFCSDLPPLTEEQQEQVFQHTDAFRDARKNLAALKQTIDSDAELSSIFGYWPVPEPDHSRNWGWDDINDKFMVTYDQDWDEANVPFFAYQRREYNRRILASLGPPYEKYPKYTSTPAKLATTIMGSDGKDHPY